MSAAAPAGISGDSAVGGGASVTATTTPTVVLDGLIISNSGNPAGGLVVYLALGLRAGGSFSTDTSGPRRGACASAMLDKWVRLGINCHRNRISITIR